MATERHLDPVERQYVAAINRAQDTPEAFELSIGLRQYRAMYQIPTDEPFDDLTEGRA